MWHDMRENDPWLRNEETNEADVQTVYCKWFLCLQINFSFFMCVAFPQASVSAAERSAGTTKQSKCVVTMIFALIPRSEKESHGEVPRPCAGRMVGDSPPQSSKAKENSAASSC